MRAELRRYFLILTVVVGISVLELVGGLVSGSLSLTADALHMASDALATVVTILVTIMVAKGYGENMVRKMGGVINALLLALMAQGVFVEALKRIEGNQEVVSAVTMITVAVIGLAGNYCQLRILNGHRDHHHDHGEGITHNALSFHIISDLALSLCVIVGGVAQMATGDSRIDGLVAIGASGLFMYLAIWLGAEVAFKNHRTTT